jgi:hypothetical protein
MRHVLMTLAVLLALPLLAFNDPTSRIVRLNFADLNAPLAGSVRYCLDCAATSPCTNGGAGAFAYRVGAVWNCNDGSGGGGGSFLATDGSTTGATSGPQILQNGITLGVSSSISGALKFFSAGSSRAMLITISTINGALGTRNVTLDVSAITGNPTWTFPNGSVDFTPLLTPTGTGNVVLNNGPTFIGPLLGTPASGVMTNVTGTAAGLTAGAATALAANGTNCSAGNYALGVDASGNSEGCTAAPAAFSVTGTGVPTVTGGTLDAAATTFTSNATASTIVSRDSSANTRANSHIDGYTTTATAAGTTTLTAASTKLQLFTGSTTQTVVLPVASTLVTGQEYLFVNSSTGTVTVNSSGSSLVLSMPANAMARIWCILTSGTSAASWSAVPVARTDVAQTFAGTQTYTQVSFASVGGSAAAPLLKLFGDNRGLLASNGAIGVTDGTNVTATLGNAIALGSGGMLIFGSGVASSGGGDVGISRGDVAGDLDCGTGSAQSVGCRFRASAVTMNINATAKTANYTTTATDYTILATTAGGAFTITLSSTNAKVGQIYNIKMTATSTNALTLSPSSGNIDGAASATITPTTLKEGAMIQFDGTNWYIIGTYSGVL